MKYVHNRNKNILSIKTGLPSTSSQLSNQSNSNTHNNILNTISITNHPPSQISGSKNTYQQIFNNFYNIFNPEIQNNYNVQTEPSVLNTVRSKSKRSTNHNSRILNINNGENNEELTKKLYEKEMYIKNLIKENNQLKIDMSILKTENSSLKEKMNSTITKNDTIREENSNNSQKNENIKNKTEGFKLPLNLQNNQIYQHQQKTKRLMSSRTRINKDIFQSCMPQEELLLTERENRPKNLILDKIRSETYCYDSESILSDRKGTSSRTKIMQSPKHKSLSLDKIKSKFCMDVKKEEQMTANYNFDSSNLDEKLTFIKNRTNNLLNVYCTKLQLKL